MKKTKFIRIDEAPNRFSQKGLSKNSRFLFSAGAIFNDIAKTDYSLPNEQPKADPFLPFFRKEGGKEHPFSVNNRPEIHNQSGSSAEINIPPYVVNQIAKINDLVLEFNSTLEKNGVMKNKIEEFQHDGFKISFRIIEGLLTQLINPELASQQFDLAVIHAENTIITLENFEEEEIISLQKIMALKQSCRKIIALIQQLKNIFN